MRILFDTGIPRALAKSLSPHQVSTTTPTKSLEVKTAEKVNRNNEGVGLSQSVPQYTLGVLGSMY